MKAEEIIRASAGVMKRLLTPEGMAESIRRAECRDAATNEGLMAAGRQQINELVSRVLEDEDPEKVIRQTSPELLDAMVLRYLTNRDVFMKTFPAGIDGIDPDPLAIWGAMMVAPGDEDLQ